MSTARTLACGCTTSNFIGPAPGFIVSGLLILLVSGARGWASKAALDAASDDRFDRLYERGVAKQQTLHSIRARFTETTVSSLLVRPLVAHGTITAQRPARVLLSYTDPEVKTLTIDGTSLVIAWPGRAERERLDITDVQKQVDRYFTHASLDELRRLFQISARSDPAVPHADRVEMRPRRKRMQEGLERLDLWIDRDRVLLVQMRMIFPGGDQKTVMLEDIEENVPASEAN